MIVLFLLLGNTCLKVLKVGHDVRVYHFDVLIILSGQMILHQAYFLSQHFDLFFILTQRLLGVGDPLFHSFHLASAALASISCNLGAVCPQGLITACCLSNTSL